MAQFAGKYKLESNENLIPLLKSLGLPEDKAAYADKLRPTLEVIVEGDKFSFFSDSGVKSSNISFTLGQEFDDELPTDVVNVVKSVASLSGNKLTVTSKSAELGIDNAVRTYELTGTGLIISFTNSKFSGVAKRTYKKL